MKTLLTTILILTSVSSFARITRVKDCTKVANRAAIETIEDNYSMTHLDTVSVIKTRLAKISSNSQTYDVTLNVSYVEPGELVTETETVSIEMTKDCKVLK